MKKWWVKALLVLVFFLLALFTWIIGAGTQSHESLADYRKRLIAAGEKLDVSAFIPPPIDSDKNGAAMFDKAYSFITPRGGSLIATNPPTPMEIVVPGKARVLWQQDEIVSVRGFRCGTNSWAALESDLASQSAAVDLLQQAATYPEFDFGIDYHQSSTPLPHISKLRQAASLLASEAIFDLHRGDTALAVKNLHALLVVANSGRNEPILVSQSMRAVWMQMAFATQWELLQAANLTDEQLVALQTNWMNLDLVKPLENTFLMARCSLPRNIEATRANGPSYSPAGSARFTMGSGGWDDFRRFFQFTKIKAGDALWRSSWCYDDELRMLEGYSVMIETVRQTQTNGYYKDALAERERKIIALGLNRTNINSLRTHLGGQLLEADIVRSVRSYATILDRMFAADAWRQCAIAAIGLKRYGLRHGALPKELSALTPEFLPAIPSDPMDGHPLRYRLNPDGTFLLYSIGLDGVDDGGNATANPTTGGLPPFLATRDWVWPQPATSAEVQYYYDHPSK